MDPYYILDREMALLLKIEEVVATKYKTFISNLKKYKQ